MGGFDWYVIKGNNCVREKCLAMANFDMVVHLFCFILGRLLRAAQELKRKTRGVITTTHHLLDNKWKNALEDKTEAMGVKVESMSNSLLHIKELCYKLQVFFKQHIHCITFTCFDKKKSKKYETLNFFICV
jgi:hypothetical protein